MATSEDGPDDRPTGPRPPVLGRDGRFLLTGTAWSAVGLAIAVLLTLLVNAIAARLLDEDGLGAFLLVLSLGQAITVLTELGQPGLLVRRLAGPLAGNRRAQAVHVRRVLVLVTASIAVTAALAVVPGRQVARLVFDDPLVVEVVALLGLVVAGRTGERVIGDVFRARRDIRRATLFGSVTTQAVATVAMGALLLLEGTTAAVTAVAAYGLATTLSNGFGLWRLRGLLAIHEDPDDAPDNATDHSPPTVGEALHEGWPLIGHRLLTLVLQQSPLWIVVALVGTAAGAPFGLALRVVTTVAIPLTVVNQVVPPLIAKLHTAGERDQLERSIRLAATLAAAMALVVVALFVLVGDVAVALAFGEQYVEEAVPLLLVLSTGQVVAVWVGSCGIVLLQAGHQRWLLGLTGVAVVLLVVAAPLAADRAGAMGVAWAAAGAIALQNLGMLVVARWLVGVRTDVSVPLAVREVRTRLRRLGEARS